MTRNVFLLWAALHSLPSFATVDSPVVQGLAGATRTGVPREGIFSNPASVASITSTYGFYHYEIPRIDDYNAGGRAWSAGLYDGGDRTWKGGFGISRVSQARIFRGQQGYVDRREVRFSTGHEIYNNIVGGVAGRLVKNYSPVGDNSFFEGDVGFLFPVFADIHGGATVENIADKEDELPRTIGVGASYPLTAGITLIADGYRLMSGTREGERGWSLATEIQLAGDFTARGGLFEEGYRALKGWAAGVSWSGPRMSLDYALKTAGKGPKERSHILGVSVVL